MDRNNIIGFSLIFVVLMVWSYFNSKQNQAQIADKRRQDSIALVRYIDDSIQSAKKLLQKPDSNQIKLDDSLALKHKNDQLGIFSKSNVASPQNLILENEVLKLTIHSAGGAIVQAELKNYKKIHEMAKGENTSSPLLLLNHPSNRWNLKMPIKSGLVQSKDLVFTVGKQSNNSIELIADAGNGKQLIQAYTLSPNSYAVDYKISMPGLKSDLNAEEINLEWTNFVIPQEVTVDYEKLQTGIKYKVVDDDPDRLKLGSADKEEISSGLTWVAHAQQFFNSTLIADAPFKNTHLESNVSADNHDHIAQLTSSITIPFTGTDVQNLKFYIGPNEFKTLQALNIKMEDIIPFGWGILGSINRWVVRPVFNFLSSFISSKGIVILLLTFLVKLILFPLSYKMLHSQSKMGALKPEMDKLREKFKNDPQQVQMESMKLYREFGVNPLGGCMPMLLQMPIWLALYQFFPGSIEFRQASFLWAHDLSSYDVFAKLPTALPFYGSHVSLFTLIWVISTLVFTYYTTKDQDFSMNPAMKYMQYLMPVFFLFFFNNSAAGLTAYMSFSNILNIGQTVGGKALFFPLAKMKEELEQARNKPKKKGGFQERLATMMQEQQKKVEDKQKQSKK